MPPPETFDLFQTAVLWRKVGQTRDNEPIVSAAEEVDCRWRWGRRESVGPEGAPIAFDARVALEEEIPDGSVMWLGELRDFRDTGRQPLMTTVTIDGTPDVKGREFRYEYGLMRFKGRLPRIED